MMTRERTALCGRRDDLSKEGEWNRAKIAGLIFRLEEAETICSHLMEKAKASRFDLREKDEVEAELRRALEAEGGEEGGNRV